MTLNLTTPIPLPNGTRLSVASINVDDDNSIMSLTFQLRSPNASDLIVSQRVVQIRNGLSDKIAKGSMPVGSGYDSALVVSVSAVSTPTGYTDAINAWRAQASANTRKAALETLGLSAGWIDATLTGT